MDAIELLNDRRPRQGKAYFAEVDKRNPRKRKVVFRDVAALYGQRPKHDSVWFLAPYEFVSYWGPVLLSYPRSLRDVSNPKHPVNLTDCGFAELRAQDAGEEVADLEPGVDLLVKSNHDASWLPFPGALVRATSDMCGSCGRRPKAQSFAGAPIPRRRAGENNRSAMVVTSYFRPWTLRLPDADTLGCCEMAARHGRKRCLHGWVATFCAGSRCGTSIIS